MDNEIKLRGISGYCIGTPAADIEIGDIIVWEFGYTSDVLDIEPSGKHSLRLTVLNHSDGKTYRRVVRRDKLLVRQSQTAVKLSKSAQNVVESHGGTIRPLTLAERTQANADGRKAANYMLCIGQWEAPTTGTMNDIWRVLRERKKRDKMSIGG